MWKKAIAIGLLTVFRSRNHKLVLPAKISDRKGTSDRKRIYLANFSQAFSKTVPIKT